MLTLPAAIKPANIQIGEIVRHPVVMFGLVLLGGWLGVLMPGSAPWLSALSALFMSLIQMAAFPFVILAVYFGTQRLASVPGAGRVLVKMIVLALLAMFLCTVIGVLVASVTGAGGLSPAQSTQLGQLALGAEQGVHMAMHGDAASQAVSWDVAALVPDNLFGALAYGAAPAVLIGVLCFGAAVAVQAPRMSESLSGILEGAYRALESLVHRFNALLPVAAFVLAAAATATAGLQAITLLSGFLLAFLLAALLVSAMAIGVLCWRLKKAPWPVLLALREPITVCLFSPVATAAVPGFIQVMSSQFGFSRALVELSSPIAPVFLKAGEAMFFAVLAIFIANLYHHTLSAGEVVSICVLSWSAALWSVGIPGAKSLILGSFVLASMGLPLEAVLPVFILVEVLCEGPRNLLSLLISSALIALVADGLYINNGQVSEAWQPASLKLVFSRKQLILSYFLVALALLAVFCAGVGAGLNAAS
ncbi:cation:dicarboxylate symporter family transporter [Janthinobacterium aquaticum]|uniref:cation:dicarboxylate symporter family transporter n=1 Tax=Janthinobacterium sp. FT58W TaxID=2654254 RepID=UPI0012654197|nr:cation:dicarboxylase symporter family transporter [Janthinobacterium sp. FT58W]KAB8044242.1 cation:dicarboxylase symporter family transporter [Janthinobacterium sp. FT58W]